MTDETNWEQALISELGKIEAPNNWSEITGPFFYIQVENHKVIGPFHGVDLRIFFEGKEFPQNIFVRDAKGPEKWVPLFIHRYFVPPTPGEEQNINQTILGSEHNEIFILQQGRKWGPITLPMLYQEISNKNILVTDLISIDEGHTWQKIYAYKNFDRRAQHNASLPESPGLNNTNQQHATQIIHLNKEQETDAIAGLAFIENQKAGKAVVHTENDSFENEVEDESLNEFKSIFLKLSGIFLIIVAIGAVVFFGDPQNPNERMRRAYQAPKDKGESNKKVSVKSKKPLQKSEIKKIETTTNKAVTPKVSKPVVVKKPRVIKKITAPSRLPTSSGNQSKESIQSREMQDRPYEDDYDKEFGEESVARRKKAQTKREIKSKVTDREDAYYNDDEEYQYDNGDAAVELDPIRNKLDKETFDPEEDYYADDYDSEQKLDAPRRAPASAEDVWSNEPSEEIRDELYGDEGIKEEY